MEVSQHWRLSGQRYALNGTRCQNCGATNFPPRAACNQCSHANGHEQPAVNGKQSLTHTAQAV